MTSHHDNEPSSSGSEPQPAAVDIALAEGIIERTEQIEARPGYSLVVYEVKAFGLKLLKILPPGELFSPLLLKPWAKYEAYRVSAHQGLRLSRKVAVKSQDQLHDFELEIGFAYRVREPEQLVENSKIDPLGRLRDEIERIVKERIRPQPWELIKHGGHELAAVLEQSGSGSTGRRSALTEIREVAAKFGIEVLEVNVERQLSEKELVKELAGQTAERERERFVIELEKQRQQSVLKARSSLDELTEVLQGMLSRAGEGVDSFSEMQRAILDLGGIRAQLAQLIQPMQSGTEISPYARDSQILLQAGSPGDETGLAGVLNEVSRLSLQVEAPARFRLAATLLHVIAATLEKEDNDPELERYRNRIDDILTLDLEDLRLSQDQVHLLRRLTQTASLRRELRGEA